MSSRTRGEGDEGVREVSEGVREVCEGAREVCEGVSEGVREVCEGVREVEGGLGVSCGPTGRGEVVGGGRVTVEIKQTT